MFTFKRTFCLFQFISIFIFFSNTNAENKKTLYVLSHDEYLYAFKIIGTTLEFQKQFTLDSHGLGPIDVEIDQDSKTLFISYEKNYTTGQGGNIIELYSATTLERLTEGGVTLTGPTDVTGLAYDAVRQKLYCTDRNTANLYVYDWDAQNLTLTADPNNPFTLSENTYACGLSLNGDTLYVSDFHYDPPNFTASQYIQSYDVSDDFAHLATVDMGTGNTTCAVDHNSTDGVLYGSFYDYYQTQKYLLKHNLSTSTTINNDIDVSPIAVVSDDDTGLLYVTTYYIEQQYYGAVQVWNTSTWDGVDDPCEPNFFYDSDNEDDVEISHLAGMCIGGFSALAG